MMQKQFDPNEWSEQWSLYDDGERFLHICTLTHKEYGVATSAPHRTIAHSIFDATKKAKILAGCDEIENG